MMRLDKLLANMGRGTRSEIKKLVIKGRVSVNGETVKDSSVKVDENADEVRIDGETVAYVKYEYWLLNKPAGVISASKADMRDPDTLCVVDLIKERVHDDLFPVGRLDKDTEGLLLITNDGDLAHRLLAPGKHVEKRYYVELDSTLSEDVAKRIEEGVDIGDDKPTLPCRIENANGSRCEIIIHEGRFHQIKRMFGAFGLEVVYLKRLSMGDLTLGDLKTGEYCSIIVEENQGKKAGLCWRKLKELQDVPVKSS